METNQPRIPARALRIVGALTSAAAVAVIGTGAMTPAAAQAAGVATGHRVPVPAAVPLASPSAITTTSATGAVVTYRVRAGQLERV
ncbi:hypothetical protein JNB_13743 [Janibacter sp. HTCC2649]|uniref:hypothetical protein n=1 Tax=Janibacter sp. HTCC2649 TaxID=313589 RepID=UPI0000671AE1|nr:hypothetical protein [Janibacter sp. HTCC2649]EAP98031.1 hypothetical protein JNB_13743 [Janibacter sp. HTCC2649]